jgi:hypothetical protein
MKRFGIAGIAGSAVLLVAQGSPALPTRSLLAEPPSWTPPMPPPLAPVDGHRHPHQSGALLRFDSALGVYTVSGVAGVYYFADGFIRHHDGSWEFSERPTGPWAPGRAEWVPLTLRLVLYP